MKIKLNGKVMKARKGLTVSALLRAGKARRPPGIVALNLRALCPEKWEKTALRDGDSVEVFSFMTGG